MPNFAKLRKRKHDASTAVSFNVVHRRGQTWTPNSVHLRARTQAVDFGGLVYDFGTLDFDSGGFRLIPVFRRTQERMFNGTKLPLERK